MTEGKIKTGEKKLMMENNNTSTIITSYTFQQFAIFKETNQPTLCFYCISILPSSSSLK
jgi:hypothetical protein